MYSTIKHPDRLERLALLLERDAANPTGVMFDLGTWAAPSDKADLPGRSSFAYEAELDMVPVSCGTRACAFGLAAISGEFAKEGLTHSYDKVFVGEDSDGTPIHGYLLVPSILNDKGEKVVGFDAAAELFGIDYGSATYLFDPEQYDSTPTGAEGEREVVDRIRQFVANGYYEDPDEDRDDDYDDSDEEPSDD